MHARALFPFLVSSAIVGQAAGLAADPGAQVEHAAKALEDAANYTWRREMVMTRSNVSASTIGDVPRRRSGAAIPLGSSPTTSGACERDGPSVVVVTFPANLPPGIEIEAAWLGGRSAANTIEGWMTAREIARAADEATGRMVTVNERMLNARDCFGAATFVLQVRRPDEELPQILSGIEKYEWTGDDIVGTLSVVATTTLFPTSTPRSPPRAANRDQGIVIFHLNQGTLGAYELFLPVSRPSSLGQPPSAPTEGIRTVTTITRVGSTIVTLPPEALSTLTR